MISLSVLVSLALLPISLAQSSSDPALQIAAIQAHFSNAGIVPSLLPQFSPSAYLTPSFPGTGDAAPGAELTQAQAKPAPTLSLTPANSTVKFDGKYTLAMVDAGPVGTDETQGQTRHMLINSVTVSGTNITTTGGTAVTAYAGPAPPSGSGPHRYVILVYTQPDNFSPPADLSKEGAGVAVFNLADYVKNSNLGPLVAANYFTVEEGTATASLSPTSAVVSSTLSVAAPSSSTRPASSSTPTSQANSAYSTSMPCSLMLLSLVAAFVF